MKDTPTGRTDRFFFGGRWRTVALIGICVWGLFALADLVRGENLDAAFQLAILLLVAWNIWWRSRRFPVITVSDEAVEWGRAQFRHAEHVLMSDVLELISPSDSASTPLGLWTHSRGTVWISLEALSAADRRKVREAIARGLKPAQGSS